MKQIIILMAFCVCIVNAQAQEKPLEDKLLSPNVKFAETINAEDLSTYLHVLASDKFQGRETGTTGNTMAAEYIASQIESFGIPPIPGTDSYFQQVAFTRMKWKSISTQIGSLEIQHQRDYLMIPSLNTNETIDVNTDEIIFMGYGVDDKLYSDYRGKDVRGKVVLVYGGEPMNEDGLFILSGNSIPSEWSTEYSKKLDAAKKAGVEMLIVISDNLREDAAQYRGELIGGTMLMGSPEELGSQYPANMKISTKLAKEMLGKKMKKVIRARKKISKKGKLKPV